MKLSNEIKVGLLAIVALIILVLGYNYLKGKNLLSGQENYYAIYEKVNGLLTANPVTVNGFRVGIVNDIQMLQDGTGRLRVAYLIDKKVKIPQGSEATIMADGLLGDMVVALEFPKTPTRQFHKPEDELAAKVAPGLTDMLDLARKELEPYQAKAQVIIQQLDSTVRAIKTIVQSEKIKNIINETETMVSTVKGTLEGTNRLVENVNGFVTRDMKKVSTILNNTENLTNNLNQEMSKISPILADAKQAVAKIHPIMDDAQQLVKKIHPIMDNTKQMMQKINPIIDNTKQIVEKINPIMDNTKKLVEKINPIMENANKLVKKINPIMENTNKLVKKINPIIDDAKQITEGAKQLLNKDLKKITADVQAITADAKVMTADAKVMAANAKAMTKEFKGMTGDLKKITTNAGNLTEDAKTITADAKKLTTQLTEANIPGLLESGKASIAQLNDLMKKVKNGEGSLGQLINDEGLYKQITTLSEEAGSLTKSLNYIVKDIEENPRGYFSLIKIGDGSRRKKRREEYKKE